MVPYPSKWLNEIAGAALGLTAAPAKIILTIKVIRHGRIINYNVTTLLAFLRLIRFIRAITLGYQALGLLRLESYEAASC